MLAAIVLTWVSIRTFLVSNYLHQSTEQRAGLVFLSEHLVVLLVVVPGNFASDLIADRNSGDHEHSVLGTNLTLTSGLLEEEEIKS